MAGRSYHCLELWEVAGKSWRITWMSEHVKATVRGPRLKRRMCLPSWFWDIRNLEVNTWRAGNIQKKTKTEIRANCSSGNSRYFQGEESSLWQCWKKQINLTIALETRESHTNSDSQVKSNRVYDGERCWSILNPLKFGANKLTLFLSAKTNMENFLGA